jgi:hypothetical protein
METSTISNLSRTTDIENNNNINDLEINDNITDNDNDNEINTDKTIDNKKVNELMKKNFSYPETNDPNLQYKLFKKKEFNFNRIPTRPNFTQDTDYKEIKDYRDNICDRPFSLHDHQGMLSNFINPDTPYKGILVFHGLGTGKTCVGVAIGEKFKEQVMKYNTKIYILCPGPIIKESWMEHLIKCTGETYKKYQDKYSYYDKSEKDRQKKIALNQALQYYKIMTFRSFYKKVLGEKIIDTKVDTGDKIKTTYRKTKDGDFERDVAIDKITNLDNSVIIVDEAHGLTGNNYGEALEEIIRKSFNLKVVLMSATPMKNLGTDIIPLINFLRPKNNPIERDKIFNSYTNHLMDFKEGGLDYFKKMINGYVSHVRGSDPLTFARRNDKGIIPKGMQFTPIIRCDMLKFQRKTYDMVIGKIKDDALERESQAVANMTIPALSKDRTHIIGKYGGEAIRVVKEQLKGESNLLNKKISETFFNGEPGDYLRLSNDGKSITGKIFESPYLKLFSIKFYKALKKINRLVAGKKGAKTAFIYSNLVVVGIDLFKEILLMNGYLEYQDDKNNYQINENTRCYYCGKKFKDHSKQNRILRKRESLNRVSEEEIDSEEIDYNNNDNTEYDIDDNEVDTDSDDEVDMKNIFNNGKIETSETSTEYSERTRRNEKIVKPHKFYPATFLTITGGSSDDVEVVISDSKKKTLDNVFNKMENKEGKNLKFILGSRVMNEGISMKNVGEVHLLDVYYNLGKVDQVVGRGIRWCSHFSVMSDENKFPYVNVYKYVVSLENGLSTEEDMYRKAELKYLLIKKIERAMKERAFDCPLNLHGNIFAEEIHKYKDCEIHKMGDNDDEKDNPCPAICDYRKCSYKCDDPQLNYEYYDPERGIYKLIPNTNIDKSTFTDKLAQSEIEFAKRKIKELYITKAVYKLPEIIKYIKESYPEEKKDLFDDFFVFKALDSLIPISQNDHNNFKDTIINKNNMKGYLIYRGNNYIFQPFDENEDVPMYYRLNETKEINNDLSLFNYLRNNDDYQKLKNKLGQQKKKLKESIVIYDFDLANEYYDQKDEYDHVGIIDKNVTQSKIEGQGNIEDEFKLRKKIPKNTKKQRETGLATDKGAVCATAKSKGYLLKLATDVLKIDIGKTKKRRELCSLIMKELYMREKYSTGKEKLTYLKIPTNHSTYVFPLNIEDRLEDRINKLKELNLKTQVKKIKKKKGDEKGYPSYEITITTKKSDDIYKQISNIDKNISKTKSGYIMLLE